MKSKFYSKDLEFRQFEGMSMAMIFQKPSSRTRVSFETVNNNFLSLFLNYYFTFILISFREYENFIDLTSNLNLR